MVNNSGQLIRLLVLAAPALASLLVAGAAWRVQTVRSGRWRRVPAALPALIACAFAAPLYFTHPAGVSDSQALGGAAVALIGAAVPLSVYYALGRLIRRLRWLTVAWLACLAPLYVCAYVVMFIAVISTQCAPGCMD